MIFLSDAMKPEQQRIAIAEACGWRIESDGYCTFVYPPGKTSGTGYRMNNIRHPKIIRLLPDCLNDLNAMHEAEKLMVYDSALRVLYIENLELVTQCPFAVSEWYCANSTAAQRAEAFLRTLNIWTEN